MSVPRHKFRVAICGGGIGGLCLAVALTKYPDIDVQVYEAAERFKEIGAGVVIWGRTWRVLSLLGLEPALREAAMEGEGRKFEFDFRRSDQPEEGKLFYLLRLRHTSQPFHRAHFLDVFINNIPPYAAHFGKRLQSYTREKFDGPIALNFEDGSQAICDLLIGCDGIKSTIRRQMYEEKAARGRPELLKHVEPRWSGWVVYRALVPAEKLPIRDGQKHSVLQKPMMYCGLHKHIVSYSIAQGKLANIVLLRSVEVDDDSVWDGPWMAEATPEEVKACYADWEPEVQELIKPIDKASQWALHELRTLPTYIDGRVALLGDAAHAMTPHQGGGAGQAIEDAYILAGVLGDSSTTIDNLESALQAYEKVRLPLANHVLESSRTAGRMHEFWSDYGDVYAEVGPAIERQYRWVDEADPTEYLERALELIRAEGGS